MKTYNQFHGKDELFGEAFEVDRKSFNALQERLMDLGATFYDGVPASDSDIDICCSNNLSIRAKEGLLEFVTDVPTARFEYLDPADGWVEHDGRGYPVEYGAMVEVVDHKYGDHHNWKHAGTYTWGGVIAYRVIKDDQQASEPAPDPKDVMHAEAIDLLNRLGCIYVDGLGWVYELEFCARVLGYWFSDTDELTTELISSLINEGILDLDKLTEKAKQVYIDGDLSESEIKRIKP